MSRLPRPIPRDLIAELSQSENGKKELAQLKAARKRELDRKWPEPELGDILELRDRLESERAGWASMVAEVRRLRFNKDQMPEKWADRLQIPADRRYHTHMSGNEISRVVGMMGRNPAKVTIAPAADTNVAKQRAEKQQRWGQELPAALERSSVLPIWERVDDAAAETGMGCFEVYMTERWEQVDELIRSRDPEVDDPELDKRIDDELKSAGLPIAVRLIDPLAFLWEPDEDGLACVVITERKHYAQVFSELRQRLSDEEFEQARLPKPGDRAWPATEFTVGYSYLGQDRTRAFGPDGQGHVEVTRYLDRRWLVEIVAGRIVQCKEHGFPGVPAFVQFGKVTSSSVTEFQLQGITMGMLSQELALNDLKTMAMDNQMTYGRPFPIITTSEQGTILEDESGAPAVIRLDDPSQPPQLGRGQTIVDAFGTFRGNIDPQLWQAIHADWQMSGLNPIAQGDSPGSDPSGYAINTLSSGAQTLYESMLDNKCRTRGEFTDFCRLVVRDTIGETMYLSVPSVKGRGVEVIGLSPDDVDEMPCKVSIDPMSDAQRLAITEWLMTGNGRGYIDRRTVQTIGFGGVINDPDETDKNILLDKGQALMLPVIVESVVKQVMADAFPEAQQTPPGPPPPGGGAEQPNLQEQGMAPAEGPTVGPARQSPVQATAARALGGQQPPSQGVPIQ